MSKKVIITGATGMIGGLVLKHCLEDSNIAEIISLSRRSTGQKHAKLKEIIHSNFTDYTEIEEYFHGIDIAYFCIGVYTGSVSRDEFRVITVDYTKAFSDALKIQSPNATLCFLSGAGADTKEKSRMMFALYKGIAENYLTHQNLKALYIFRPGYVYPVTPRKEPNFTYRLSRKLYPMLKRLMPNGVISSEELASAIFKVGLMGYEKSLLENIDIKRI